MIKYFPVFSLLIFNGLCLHAQKRTDLFVVQPYLQYATQTGIRIHWETADSCTSFLQYGTAKFNTGKVVWDATLRLPGNSTIHHAVLHSLKPETVYFYRAISILSGGDSLISETGTFQTAVKDSTAFAFAVFSDSQFDHADPGAWGRVSTQAWKERPNFALHAGDLVDRGHSKNDWVSQFFAPAHTFMKTIPMFSIPGNHEDDAAHFYQYMYVPLRYYYSFKYGNAEFFMIDTNQYQELGTDMYNWLEQALAKSTAYWKFVVHHHPPYSSDDNDFGNTYAETSTLGDDEAIGLTPLYDKYGVDIVFYGHIHTYERTWPIRNRKVDTKNGVIYLNVGGAGGRLENPAPVRSWFSNKLRTVHHFGYIAIHDNTLQFQAIDDEGKLFDSFTLTGSRKGKMSRSITPAAPTATNERKLFTDSIHVKLQSATAGDIIRYTLNGKEPDNKSPVYRDKIILNKTTTITAASFNKYGRSRSSRFEFIQEKMHPAITLSIPKPGLEYRYFVKELQDNDTKKFDNLNYTRTGVVKFPDLTAIEAPEPNWGVEFEGFIKVPADGYYHFSGHAEHLLKLEIHGKTLFEELRRNISYEGGIFLAAGYHPVKITYTNRRFNLKFLELYYSGPGIQRQAIPAAAWWRSK